MWMVRPFCDYVGLCFVMWFVGLLMWFLGKSQMMRLWCVEL